VANDARSKLQSHAHEFDICDSGIKSLNYWWYGYGFFKGGCPDLLYLQLMLEVLDAQQGSLLRDSQSDLLGFQAGCGGSH
jgi:hypothetical protein